MRIRRKASHEQGVVITLVAVFMLGVIAAMAALSIDVATIYTARSEAQLAADGAALAAARVIANSGATSDPSGALLGTVQSPGGVAQTIALQVAEQNLVGGVPLTASQITIAFGGVTTNPTVTVSIKKTDLPTFFARIWGVKQVTVAASATAEAYNPSGDYALNLSDPIPVAPTSVKPWLLPNLDPSGTGATPIFVPATGTVAATASGLLGYTTPSAGGSTRLKLACGAMGTVNPLNCVAPGLPAPIAFQYYPGDPASFIPPPQTAAPSCNPALSTPYEYSVAAGARASISCNAKVNIDQAAYTTRNTETADAVNCMAHTAGNQGDMVTTTAPPTDPFTFVAGTDNPIPSLAGNSVMVSDSLVTVPVFDTTGGTVPANPVTIIGFLQLFLAPQGLATPPANGHMRATVVNVVSCGSGWTASPIIGNGSSPVTVRLISAAAPAN